MDITNKTQKALRLPLPGGKKLFLGPGRTGQISPKATDHPPLKALIDAGEVELQVGKHSTSAGTGTGGKGTGTSEGHSGGGAVRHTGDR